MDPYQVQPFSPVGHRPPTPEPAAVRPSPVFLLVVAATAVGVWLAVSGAVDPGIAVFVLVVSGWVLSLILHEFAHAYTAWKGGDRSIPAKGYLTLDPRRYADPVTSLALPLVFVILGALALPGGAVWINRAALRSRARASLVSLAGPAVNLVLGTVCLLPLSTGLVEPSRQPTLAVGLGLLGFLQVMAFVLNMIPFPGLDGFGALEPYLPRPVLEAIRPLRGFGIMILIAVLFFVQPVNRVFWDVMLGIVGLFSVDDEVVRTGFRLFRFWEE